MNNLATDPTATQASPAALRALIESRRAVRRFSAQSIPDEVIRDCLEMAVLAPNSCNLQPWSFQVVRDPALLEKAKTGDKVRFSAEQKEGAIVVTAIEPAP
mgnify:CR=1 FL=1